MQEPWFGFENDTQGNDRMPSTSLMQMDTGLCRVLQAIAPYYKGNPYYKGSPPNTHGTTLAKYRHRWREEG